MFELPSPMATLQGPPVLYESHVTAPLFATPHLQVATAGPG